MASVMAIESEIVGEFVEEIRIEVGGGEMLGIGLVCLEFLG